MVKALLYAHATGAGSGELLELPDAARNSRAKFAVGVGNVRPPEGNRTTDVFELQLAELAEQDMAWPLGIALRQWFARRLGVAAQEAGVAVRLSKDANGTQLLVDLPVRHGGSRQRRRGAMRRNGTAACREARDISNRVHGCDAACPGSLLTYGTQCASDALRILGGVRNRPDPWMLANSCPVATARIPLASRTTVLASVDDAHAGERQFGKFAAALQREPVQRLGESRFFC